MEDIWKPVVGYEGLYEVSNLGNVRNKYGRILKLEKTRAGYLRVSLCINSITKRFSVHRLVAQAFIPNPNNLPCINHRDENKVNNNVENLEWCSYSYNNRYNNAYEKRVKTRKRNDNYSITEETRCKMRSAKIGKTSFNAMKVSQFTKDGKYIATFSSMRDASIKTGVCHSSITQVCKGERKTAGNYIWHYAS